MTVPAGQLRPARTRPQGVVVALLVVGLGSACVLRRAVAGERGPGSVPAGLAFAVALMLLAGGAWRRMGSPVRSVQLGVTAAAIIVLPAILRHAASGVGSPVSAPGHLRWALATTLVATAEEIFLRGALFEELLGWRGEAAAVLGAAAAFAGLHVPLYGWRAVPVDFAVGVVLGVVRVSGGGWLGPAVAHVLADQAGWWLV